MPLPIHPREEEPTAAKCPHGARGAAWMSIGNYKLTRII